MPTQTRCQRLSRDDMRGSAQSGPEPGASLIDGAEKSSPTSGSRAVARNARLRHQVPSMRLQAAHHALFLICGCLSIPDALADDAAGVVKTVKGTVQIERSGASSGAAIGSEVYGKDRIVTGPQSSVGITLRDTTQLSAGADTILDLNQFAFNTTTHGGVLDASVKRGSLAVISGKLAKANPDAVRFSTPTTTLGVRGTEFIIEVGGKGEGAR
ncbi:FecR family protein [Paraburkholderia sp. BL25I1N1]|uniref:FecR family protein n=1 Tax=Paraburkholderia sp. BL25I1N1 TaxID=1938804 RepID=UPI002159B025|nr:FecR family protein [Paraburkholderia sp. BL25I1N1]